MTEKRGMKALELWCRRVTEGYPGVKIENMTTSWRDGLAFCALIHHFRPDLIDFDRLDKRDIYKNNELAFRIAERQLGIPALLDAEDMVEYEVPDRLSILTYLSQFYQTFVSSQQGTTDSSPKSHSSKVPEMISPSTKTPKASKVGAGRLESCWSCRRPVFLAERLVAGGKLRHRTCFTCKRCGHQLNLVGCYETEEGDFVCETCPDEEKRDGGEVSKGVQEDDEGDSGKFFEDSKDEYSLNFESALDSIVASRQNETKSKFLQDLVDGSSDLSETTMDSYVRKSMSSVNDESLGFESLPRDKLKDDVKNSFPVDGVSKNQHSTASVENLNIKIKSLLGRDFSETLSLLNQESDSFIADVAEIIDSIIDDAVKDTENRVQDSSATTLSLPCEEKESAEIAVSDTPSPSVKTIENDDVAIEKETRNGGEISELKESQSIISKEVTPELPKKDLKSQTEDYPEDLNPFADDDDDDNNKGTAPAPVKPPVTPRKTPVPAARTKTSRPAVFNKSGQKIIEAPVVNLNPFWSDGEPSSDEDVAKPVPSPRSTPKYLDQDSPFSRSQYGSYTSLNSVGSSASTFRKKKAPAPPPPLDTKHLQYPGSPESIVSSLSGKSSSPTPTIRSHRKSKPAPPPPIKSDESGLIIEKKEKNYENKMKQNLSVPDKSSYGKWKRKKGQAPGLPIPQRRRITPLPLPELYRELEDLEIQQRELERQGVTIEQTIRKFEGESLDEEEKKELEGKDVEGLILQLFEIVNQKNELFRRQAELMYLRRQQRLEEEHADLEYQIRCLMGRPERNKTDSDKEQEEELIKRLVEVVERRNEIIECLDMDRKREVEEDESIHHHLEAFAGKIGMSEDKEKPKHAKSSPSFLKYMKKKKSKKEKSKEGSSVKVRRDADKDIDEANKDEEVKVLKTKKKWFVKP